MDPVCVVTVSSSVSNISKVDPVIILTGIDLEQIQISSNSTLEKEQTSDLLHSD